MQPKDVRILIVDDEADFRDALAFSFIRMGYRVLTASNGNEAFELLQEHPIDVIISDVIMPESTGTDLLDRLKNAGAVKPVILLVTGFTDLTSEQAHKKGAEALFSKPVDRKALVEMVTLILASRIGKEKKPELKPGTTVSLSFHGAENPVQAQVLQLGRSGMFVTVEEGAYPNVNDDVSFKILFGDAGSGLDGTGITKWVRTKNALNLPIGCGIEFTHLSAGEQQQILDFIKASKTAGSPEH